MHLGRFHKSINDLSAHFKKVDIPSLIDNAAATMDRYASSQTQAVADEFRTQLSELLRHIEITDPEIYQPYTQEIIRESGLQRVLPPVLPARLREIVSQGGFDHTLIASNLRLEAQAVRKVISSVIQIDTSLGELQVEFETVNGSEECEVGLLIPREAVGETLPKLTGEFQQIGHLSRAINELTGAADYDPKIRTISSSEWQLFLEITPEQVAVWVLVVEKIIGLFKSNLEIKRLQQQLSENSMPKAITDAIDKEIEKRVTKSMEALAAEVVQHHSKLEDKNRQNEVEGQLRQGLRHLAKRLNQGAQVEVNVGVPDAPTEETAGGATQGADVALQVQTTKERIAHLRELRNKAHVASVATLGVKDEKQGLLPYLGSKEDQGG